MKIDGTLYVRHRQLSRSPARTSKLTVSTTYKKLLTLRCTGLITSDNFAIVLVTRRFQCFVGLPRPCIRIRWKCNLHRTCSVHHGTPLPPMRCAPWSPPCTEIFMVTQVVSFRQRWKNSSPQSVMKKYRLHDNILHFWRWNAIGGKVQKSTDS